MAFSNWFCPTTTKNTVVKIVHPGGRVELHEEPVLAADIVQRNPKCCLAYPTVFRQPWDVVLPETTLLPGQKFYVVPISTIRKLQCLSLKHTPSLIHEFRTNQNEKIKESHGNGFASTCWLFTNKKEEPKHSCFTCLLAGIKGNNNEDSSKETRSSNSSGSSDTKEIIKRGGSPKRHSSFDNWQPRLEIINEE